jgi:hypothetical protein
MMSGSERIVEGALVGLVAGVTNGRRFGDVDVVAGYPRGLVDRLEAFARATGESVNDILVDALGLHLDDLDIGDEE